MVLALPQERGPCPIRELLHKLSLYYTLSPMIDRLGSSGLVMRMRQPSNKHSVLVELTHDARDLCEIHTKTATRFQATLIMDDEEFLIIRSACGRDQQSTTR
ncbi:hypothetical protein AB0M48_11950 [Lentzea sp. NPDC051208]|uniref:hypothetical protein n=1 Tax=Lentzea sp. NPDC051208 TaxID=3154642 RepID=UPI00342552A3